MHDGLAQLPAPGVVAQDNGSIQYSTCSTHDSMLTQSHTDCWPGQPSRNQSHANHQDHPVAQKYVAAVAILNIIQL